MEKIWTAAAGLFLIAAAVCLWWNNLSATFVTATLGAVAWFLSYRAQVRAKMATETEPQPIEDTDED